MMIGGALVPFKVLVDHLVSQRKSIHPAINMCQADIGRLEMETDLARGLDEFPLLGANFWLTDILNFSPSAYSQNDIKIVQLDDILGNMPRPRGILEHFLRDLTSGLTGMLLLAGTVCSILAADIWSNVLFGCYVVHWVASELVSRCSMVACTRSGPARIREDATSPQRRHAIYKRPEGGRVIFTGRQDALERWARVKFAYVRTPVHDSVHWLWMLSGALSCAASVICMVNMAASLQLAFLGTLALGSLGEVGVTLLVRRTQKRRIEYGTTCATVRDHPTWSSAIASSVLVVPDEFALDGLDWIALGQLPDSAIFRTFCALLRDLRDRPDSMTPDELRRKLVDHGARSERLADRLVAEIERAREEVRLPERLTRMKA